MSTISKEWLQQTIAEYEANRDELPFGLDTNSAIELQAFKFALASLESVPVAYIRDGFRADGVHFCGGIISAEEHERTLPALSERHNWKHQPLYIAPPTPANAEPVAWLWSNRKHPSEVTLVRPEDDEKAEAAQWSGWSYKALYAEPPVAVSVPEPIKRNDADGWWMYKGRRVGGGCAEWYNRALDDCRAAMLQDADTELQRKSAIHDALCEKYKVESLSDFVDWQRNHIAELEAAPPAPVGPGETAVMPDYPGYVMTQRECYQAGKKAGLAELVTTTYKLPEGLVAVPVEPTMAMLDEFDSIIDYGAEDSKEAWRRLIAAAPQQEVK
ncbi:hypothetical protein [Enterobacter mori]